MTSPSIFEPITVKENYTNNNIITIFCPILCILIMNEGLKSAVFIYQLFSYPDTTVNSCYCDIILTSPSHCITITDRTRIFTIMKFMVSVNNESMDMAYLQQLDLHNIFAVHNILVIWLSNR